MSIEFFWMYQGCRATKIILKKEYNLVFHNQSCLASLNFEICHSRYIPDKYLKISNAFIGIVELMASITFMCTIVSQHTQQNYLIDGLCDFIKPQIQNTAQKLNASHSNQFIL